MKVYVFIGEDRHTDPLIQVFSSKDAAMAYVEEFQQGYMPMEDFSETHPLPEHWVYAATWGEGNGSRVEVCEIDQPRKDW